MIQCMGYTDCGVGAGPHGALSAVFLAISGVTLVAAIVFSTLIARHASDALPPGLTQVFHLLTTWRELTCCMQCLIVQGILRHTLLSATK